MDYIEKDDNILISAGEGRIPSISNELKKIGHNYNRLLFLEILLTIFAFIGSYFLFEWKGPAVVLVFNLYRYLDVADRHNKMLQTQCLIERCYWKLLMKGLEINSREKMESSED